MLDVVQTMDCVPAPASAPVELAVARALAQWLYGGSSDGTILAMAVASHGKVGKPPPWVSKERINKAGAAIRKPNTLTAADVEVLDAWRAAHSYVINTFQALLRMRTRGTDNYVGQRLKRRRTIVDKLFREPGMQLSRMDDIAGCRIIFPSIEELNKFREAFHKAKFNHKRRNRGDRSERYNYILNPKATGYRGIHDIYEYNVKSKTGQSYNGLLLELQYRMSAQHAWASAVEVVGLITENQPKFNRGDELYQEFFKLASEVIARAHEGCKSAYPDLSDEEVVSQFQKLDAKINLMRMLHGLSVVNKSVPKASNVILQLSAEDGQLTIHHCETMPAAIDRYFTLEKAYPKDDIVLVGADTFDQLRSVYRNYFTDTTEFLTLVAQGCAVLGQGKLSLAS